MKRLYAYYMKNDKTFIDIFEKDYKLLKAVDENAKRHGFTREGYIEELLKPFGIKAEKITYDEARWHFDRHGSFDDLYNTNIGLYKRVHNRARLFSAPDVYLGNSPRNLPRSTRRLPLCPRVLRLTGLSVVLWKWTDSA